VLKRVKEPSFFIFDAAGIIFYIIGQSLPGEPLLRILAIAIAILFLSCFNVWKDERNHSDKLRGQLIKIKNDVPTFRVGVEKLTKFTVQGLIDTYAVEVENLKRVIDTGLSSEMRSIISSAFTQHLSVLGARGETNEEKYDRLKDYLIKLEECEARLQYIYMIDLNIVTTKSDDNIETTIHSIMPSEMTVENDYVNNLVPKLKEFEVNFASLVSPITFPTRLQSKVWLASRGGHSEAFSKIASMNAKRTMRIFEDHLYVETQEKEIELEVVVHSKKRDNEQNIKIIVSTKDAFTEQLGNQTSRRSPIEQK